MALSGIERYGREVEERFLGDKLRGRGIPKLSDTERFLYHGAKMLTEFQGTGIITPPARTCRKKDPIVFDGAIGGAIIGFLDHKRSEERLAVTTLYGYRHNLFPFLQYCNKKGIRSIQDIDLAFILGYLSQLDCRKKTAVQLAILSLRSFTKYAYRRKLLAFDLSHKIPRYRSVDRPKLPSTYTREEVERLILSVDRSSAMGKRNYAIIPLAARLGLRGLGYHEIEVHGATLGHQYPGDKTGQDG